ncbi:response regulator receiver domain-containing protein [Streptohalobacillus salinus]|uniref:Response regulator receiver domain-containing protein n=1 Tax=Streptohalobacillus salinus TaxID=621096 RepID=A0A2V3WH42_9BACI|nr:response regulator [Streptohalobacillus salinus]PXW92731.1 response regulator receiver domain-containing protein [Streptohalobacillus salinus]
MKKILVVDDELVLRMLIVDSLEDLGYPITEAENGHQALKLINENHYDIIILDYMMPGMTGIELLDQLDPTRMKKTSIVMLTAKTQEKDQDQAKGAGVDVFMKKPFSPLALYDLIEELLHG